MRKHFLLLAVLLLTTYVYAAPIDPTRAINVAEQFMPAPKPTAQPGKAQAPAQQQASEIVYTHYMPKSGKPAIYVVNIGNAFAIVSADDVAHPILGYNYSKAWPTDGNLPPQVKSFFDDLAQQMEAAAEHPQDIETAAEWQNPRNAPKRAKANDNLPDSVGPLLTTTWDQGQYYNALCPADGQGPDGHVYTGCVATAMAQIINYWGQQQTIHTRGIHSYQSNYGELTVNYDTTTYDFANMPNALTSTSTPQEVNAVAKLMYHCGVAVNMGYGSAESSAYDQDARAALINFYKINPDASFAEKEFFTDEEWADMLRQEIAAGRPVYYSGRNEGSGHAFVCNGYQKDGYFYFNFGWSGISDGWYLPNATIAYTSNQTAIVGIVPDATGNVILGQTQGTSTFVVDEPLEFYHTMGHNAYEGSNFNNSCTNNVLFYAEDLSSQLVLDILSYKGQSMTIKENEAGNELRRINEGEEYNLSPVESSLNTLLVTYRGDLYYSGFHLAISKNSDCRMISNVVTTVDTTVIHLKWTANGSVTQWEVEYGLEGYTLGQGTKEIVDLPNISIIGLTNQTKYDVYIRPICRNLWYGPITKKTDQPYWIDVVTSQPEGYVIDEEGNVTISSAEGLAWWAKLANEQYNYWKEMVYQVPYIPSIEVLDLQHLYDGWYYNRPMKITADIDLGKYKWKPVKYFGDIDGQMHKISNMKIQEEEVSFPYYGFLAYFSGYTIKNLQFQNPIIHCPTGYYGVLAGGASSCTIKNVGVSNGVIEQYSTATFYSMYNVYGIAGGGLLGFVELTKIENSYSTGQLSSNNSIAKNGGIIGLAFNLSSINNVYSSVDIHSDGLKGSICAAAEGLNMRNCYGAEKPYPILAQNSLHNGGILDTVTFNGNTQILSQPMYFDEDNSELLIGALNKRVSYENSSDWMTWSEDEKNINNGLPVLSGPFMVTCHNTCNISAKNIIDNNSPAVLLAWDNDESVSRWKIKCVESDSLDITAKYYETNQNSIIISDLIISRIYRIYVKPICEEDNQGGWGEGVEHVFEKPYWTDLVTSQPDGYSEDVTGNVTITTREGFIWLSCVVNGLHGQQVKDFHGKRIKLMTDIDLSGYRWMPIGNTWQNPFNGAFDGMNHTIKNAYVNEYHDWVGVFGHGYQNLYENIVLDSCVIKGYSEVGALCGLYQQPGYDWSYGNAAFNNCHVKHTSVYGDSKVGGIAGRIDSYWDMPKLNVRNCSVTGEIYGSSNVGGLYGLTRDSVKMENCYSNCDIVSTVENTGGLVGFMKYFTIQNCYSAGDVASSGISWGKILGYLCDNVDGNYLYTQSENDNHLFGWIGGESIINNCAVFSQSGQLHNSILINATSYTDLLSALNAWVDENNSEGIYRHWVADTENVNGGLPIFDSAESSATGIEAISYDQSPMTTKILRNGQIYILRGDRVYTLQGQEVK